MSDFYKYLVVDRKLLTDRLKKNPVDWSEQHTQTVKKIKEKVKFLPYLNIIDIAAFKIVETDASNIGYEGILKQRKQGNEQLVKFTSGTWNSAQDKYSTIKKEILAIVQIITKF